jgi:hypothetical protein
MSAGMLLRSFGHARGSGMTLLWEVVSISAAIREAR